MDLDLTLIWAILIATAVFLYVAMDGFDLGLGILFPAVRGKAERDVMVNSVAPSGTATRLGSCWAAAGCLRCFRWPTPRSCPPCTCH